MRRFVMAVGAVMAISGAAAPVAGAAANPFGTGEPGAFQTNAQGTSFVACGADNTSIGGFNAMTQPQGFTTGGFTNAASVYANPGTTSGAPNAVSEYDIACYQLTQNSH